MSDQTLDYAYRRVLERHGGNTAGEPARMTLDYMVERAKIALRVDLPATIIPATASELARYVLALSRLVAAGGRPLLVNAGLPPALSGVVYCTGCERRIFLETDPHDVVGDGERGYTCPECGTTTVLYSSSWLDPTVALEREAG